VKELRDFQQESVDNLLEGKDVYCQIFTSDTKEFHFHKRDHPFPQANCLQILVESLSILSLQIFATGPTFLTFNQTHYERNDLIG
jgi:hypothetical protein